jgi:hypothetical protein
MSAPPPPQDDHLTLLPTGATRDSARRSGELGPERRERREFQPSRQQIEVGIAGGRRPGSSALRSQLGRDGARVCPPAQSDSKQAGRVSEPLAHELLETKPQLRLVGARREIGHTAPLLTQRGEISDQLFQGLRVGMEEQLTPDRPERRRGSCRGLLRRIRLWLRGQLETLADRLLLQPGTRVRHDGRSSHRGEGTQSDRVTKQSLSVGNVLEAEGPVKQVGTLSANAQRGALEARRGTGRAGAERVATEQRREFVGGRERVRRIALRGIGERNQRFFGGGESAKAQRGRHGVNSPVPINEIRAARGRRGEDCE